MASEVVVQTQNLTKRYGDFTSLDALTINVTRGSILGFIGPNGAGKTTTIKILVGLSKPTSGSASIAGVDCVSGAKQIKHLVGYMPDTFGAYDNMRVREYLDFFGAAFKIPRKQRMKRIDEVMDITGSTYMKDRYVEALSHGMKQRCAIARTMLHDPQVLILDEPANGLDPNARIDMRQILLRLAEMGKTLIVTSHILPELSRICDTVAIIAQGKLQAFGTLSDIMRNLSQKRQFEIQLLSGDNVGQVEGLVKQGLGEEAEVESYPAEAMVRITTTRTDDDLARLLNALTKMKLGICQFREVVQDLEDAFLSVTGTGRKGAHGMEKASGPVTNYAKTNAE
ncbi:MAG TPA: ABC transporter ATP-binding protein [Phycisphaerales bacterium]|nr:ABC transporter ATP-binding protein [Phycisphaerales bacterium]HCD33446.1 ABC transporter ATP-binding protein [Phycisphaerales bacterium]|tara:strand:+ start:1511 stop:2530 length:1020 start_codon:yes stop_codon:yes gene_type:complete